MATLTIHDVDPTLKTEAMEIMRQHGMTAKDTISAFLRKIVSEHRNDTDSCFCSDLELNVETMRDLDDAKAGMQKYNKCKDTDELFSQLGI